ncbi:hypothetical protein OIO90_004230 [Microbotryomycetes sp. JL221]|nr:hypothetical protein OIO90_004230 [Microbotryomycetes sp. JL221]
MEAPQDTSPAVTTSSLKGFNGGLQPLEWSKWNTREFWIGDFDYVAMFMPYIPGLTPKKYQKREMPFFGPNERLPILLMLLLGFQHSLAMLGGLVTPPILLGGGAGASLTSTEQAYLISASLIWCGFGTMLQVSSIKLPFGYFIGSSVLTVTGTSFAFIGSSLGYINSQYAPGGICQRDELGNKTPCPEAFGAVLGTATVVGIIAVLASFAPTRIIRKMFPPLVTGTIMTLIGVSLLGSGISNWAGGSGTCMSDLTVPCVKAATWGSPQLIGLGFLTFISIILLDLFGPPFIRNCAVFIGLAIGMIVAAGTGYFNGAAISAAPGITFNWVHRFPLSIKGDLVLPFLASYIVVLSETVGNVSATCQVSGLSITDDVFPKRVQGSMLADTLVACFGGLATVSPATLFSQNVGVVSFTRNASRYSGYVCGAFLVLAGVIAKFGSLFVAMPASVLGGLTTFLFGSVAIAGIRLLALCHWTRRTRFILTCAMSLGFASVIKPEWFSYFFTYSGDNAALKGFLNAITLVVEEGYLIAAFIAIPMNLLVPYEQEDLDAMRMTSDGEQSESEVVALPIVQPDQKRSSSISDSDAK